MATDNAYEGGCSCGELRYRINANPLIVHACHCRQCQRIAGGAFVMNALVEKSEVETLSGDTADCHFPATSHTAFFALNAAPMCGVNMLAAASPHAGSCASARWTNPTVIPQTCTFTPAASSLGY
jgi:hypothetical protein